MSDWEIGSGARVDTASMLRAAAALHGAVTQIDQVRATLIDLAAASSTTPGAAGALEEAVALLAHSRHRADEAGDGLRTAAVRYASAEEVATGAARAAGAGIGALFGAALRWSLAFGPAGPAVIVTGAGVVVLGAVGLEVIREKTTTGRIDPQLDPLLLAGGRVLVSSLDDVARGFMGSETARDLVSDDPDRPFSTEQLSLVAAGVWGAIGGLAAAEIAVRQVGARRAVEPPATVEELAARIPSADPGAPQVRIERYGDGADRHWIVYIAGTVTFEAKSGTEPFDMRSNLQGVEGAWRSPEFRAI